MYLFVVISFVLSAVFMPLIMLYCKKRSLYDYQDSRKIHSGNIPRLGGIGIFAAFFIPTVIFLLTNKNISGRNNLPLLIACAIIFATAIIDDLKNLPAWVKLLFQLIAVTIVTVNGYRFTQIFYWHLPTWFSFILTFGWILGVINAYNLIDGLDGLCGTLSCTALVTLGILYTITNNIEANICFILAAAVLGFLVFNYPPAKIFMGDSGSQFLGFMIAIIPLYTADEKFEFNKFIIMLILTAFPVFDTIAAIWRRLREHRPIMSADRSHLHHKFLNMGYTGKQTLLLISLIQILLCGTVVFSYFLGKLKGTAILLEDLGFMCIFFGVVHFTNRRVNLQKQAAAAQTEQKNDEPAADQKEETKE